MGSDVHARLSADAPDRLVCCACVPFEGVLIVSPGAYLYEQALRGDRINTGSPPWQVPEPSVVA